MYSKTAGDSGTVDSSNRGRSNRARFKLLKLAEKSRVWLLLIYFCPVELFMPYYLFRGCQGRTLRRLPVLAHPNYTGPEIPAENISVQNQWQIEEA